MPLLAVCVVAAACSTSPTQLEDAVDDKPGVLSVSVERADGDDALPFQRVPNYVTVRMAGDATAEQVRDVLHAYDDDIDDGDVGSVDVVLDGPKHATLSVGEGIHVADEVVDDLVAAQTDTTVATYLREAYPVLPSVHITVPATNFAGVQAVADRYQVVKDADGSDAVENVEVVSGRFLLIRDAGNEDLTITTSREDLVEKVADRFTLLGAAVGGRGPLELWAAPVDVRAVSRMADRVAGPRVGNVVVRPVEPQ
ncbi:hypothetical protein [Nocardioides sp.]|uniref:hypothetical protein n=1 Tax=Nocardioides sp. TaxID=35761 RepID=UPI0037850A29